MSAQMSSPSEFKNWFAAAGMPRQMPHRAAAPRKRTSPAADQSDTTPRASAASTGTEARKVEEWASDCLTDCYNR